MRRTIGFSRDESPWPASSACIRELQRRRRRCCIELTMQRFVVYAASAIYIVGIPEIRLTFGPGEQEALL
jgi:hypothetical protein